MNEAIFRILGENPARKHSVRSCAAILGLVAAAAFLLLPNVSLRQTSSQRARSVKPRMAAAFGLLPLSFEVNQGQTDGQVRFLSRGSGYSLFLTSNEAVLSLKPSRQRKGAVTHPRLQNKTGPLGIARGSDWFSAPSAKSVDEKSEEGAILHMKLVGANPSPRVTGLEELPGKSNYFIGNDPAKWRTNVPTYAKVRYENVYSGIDLVYYGNQRQLEYDFVVAPGADPRAIRLAIQSRDREGAVPLRIDGQGDLVLEAEGSELRLHQPVIYQEISGARQSVGGNFVIQGGPSDASAQEGGRQVGFEVARYDASKPLIIDPVLSYSTYLGGSRYDEGSGIAVDSSGNAYVTGVTDSPNFPTANAFQAVWGNSTCGTSSTTPPCYADAFVTKLNANGSALVYSTYLGGAGSDGGSGIAVDSSGNAYVTGVTGSPNFPTANAFQAKGGGSSDAFVTKLNATGSALVYSTYLGGSDVDQGTGIAVDSSGNAYVTGITLSTNYPTANAFQPAHGGGDCGGGQVHYYTFPCYDAFVTKLNPAGSALVYSTYLGGSGDDWGRGIAVDSSGNAYVTGITLSTNYPTANAFQATPGGGTCPAGFAMVPCHDAFVTKLNAAGSALVYSTYLGGSSGDCGLGIAVDSSGNAYVTGDTSSTNFPTANAFQAAFGGGPPYLSGGVLFLHKDAFVTKLNAAGSVLVYSTYLGGSDDDDGQRIAVDSSGNAYVTGETSSTNFPTANAFQAAKGGDWDAFVTKLNAAGSALIYSTYLGGSFGDCGTGIAVDSSGNAYVTGSTQSPNFPTANPFQAATSGPFVTKFPAVTAGATCTYSLSSTSPWATAAGGAGAVNVTVGSGCSWTAVSNVSWIHVTAGASGSGNGTVGYTVDVNATTSPRTGTITIGGQTFTVNQAAASANSFEPVLVRNLTPGFYIVEATTAPAGADGYWGLEVLTSKGQAAGGFNLGGAVDNRAAFGAFMVSTTQTVTATLNAQVAAGVTLTMRFLDSQKNLIGSPVSGSPPLTLKNSSSPGFYVIEVNQSTSTPYTFQLGLAADFFAGGVDAGGYVGAGLTGFGAFYVPETQDVTMKLYGRTTYGVGGAGDLVLTLKDANRNVITTVKP
jgi:hypothetical protein